MYNLLIVDDEKIVIEGLLSAVDWQSIDINVVGTAYDGDAAYQMIVERHPDIVMADIRMPGLNGLDLIQKVKEINSDTVFIIISGYTQFDYAKRAIELSAVDYLTKPIEIEEIMDSLQRAVQKLVELQERKDSKLKLNEFAEEKYILSGLLGNHIPNSDYNNKFKNCTVLITENTSEINQEKVNDIRKSIRNELYEELFLYLVENYIVFVCFGRNEEQIIPMERLLSFINQEISHPIVGISSLNHSVLDIQKAYKEAIEAYKIGLYLNQEVTKYEELEKMNHEIGPNIMDDIYAFFSNNNVELNNISTLVDHIQNHCMEKRLSPHTSKYLTFQVINQIADYVNREFDVNVESVLDEEKFVLYKQLTQLRSIDEQRDWLLTKVSRIIEYFQDNQMSQKEKLIYDVKKYLKQHYAEVIGLEDIAEEFHISPAYLSSLFSKKEGVTLFEYIVQMRITKSKELLRTTNRKISEICVQVGYENQRYFNQVFKKYCGVSPGTYRSKHLVK